MARISSLLRAATDTVPHPFPSDTAGLPDGVSPTAAALDDGATFALRAGPIRQRVGSDTLRMLAYNGSIPGPTIRVAQGSQATIDVTNETDVPTTVHWHGIRLDNPNDGVPSGHHRGMQPPIRPGESFSYRLRFPDPGVYWYHPHVREDYSQELGLYGNIVVEPADPGYWAPANREELVVLDDILVKRGRVAPFDRKEPNRTAMGRYGNVMLVNGQSSLALDARRGEVVRLYLTNTANVRPFRFAIPGATMKLVGGDGGRIEREELVAAVVIAPSERVVVDVLFHTSGELEIEHQGPDKAWTLGRVTVSDEPVEPSFEAAFRTLRTDPDLAARRTSLAEQVERAPDKSLELVALMPGMTHGGGEHDTVPIEWEDTMALHNRMTNTSNMFWKLVEPATGLQNREIDWTFRTGDLVKLRIANVPHSDHPMQHPFHIHGQRFLVLARDGVANPNLGWKDTVLIPTGETVDLLVEMSNPGTWMAHCHIAEHLESGMMLSFEVRS